jgi:hypothetical protein
MKIGENELTFIHSMAVDAMRNLSLRSQYQNTVLAQSYAFTSAVVQFLNSKQLLAETIDIPENLDKNYEKE